MASILDRGAESCLNFSQPLEPQCLLCFSGSRDGHIWQLPQCGQIFMCKGCVRNLKVSELGGVAFGGDLSLQSCVLSASSSMQDWTHFHVQPRQHASPSLSVSPGATLHPVAIPDGLGRNRPFCVIQCQHCLSMSRIGHSLQWSIVQCDFVCLECLQDARLPSFWHRCPRPASFNCAGLPSLQVPNALQGGLQGPVHPQQAEPRVHSDSSGRQAGVSCVVHCNQFESRAESGPTPQFVVTPGVQDAHEPNFKFPVPDLCLDPELLDLNPHFALGMSRVRGLLRMLLPIPALRVVCTRLLQRKRMRVSMTLCVHVCRFNISMAGRTSLPPCMISCTIAQVACVLGPDRSTSPQGNPGLLVLQESVARSFSQMRLRNITPAIWDQSL